MNAALREHEHAQQKYEVVRIEDVVP